MKHLIRLCLIILLYLFTLLFSHTLYMEYYHICDIPYEVVNTADDMIEWIRWDIQEGKVDSITGAMYIENLSYICN